MEGDFLSYISFESNHYKKKSENENRNRGFKRPNNDKVTTVFFTNLIPFKMKNFVELIGENLSLLNVWGKALVITILAMIICFSALLFINVVMGNYPNQFIY